VARDPSVNNIFTRLLCIDMGILNFLDNVRRGVMILKAGKGREGVANYCDIVVVDFGRNVLDSFKNCQSFCGMY